VDQDHHNRRWTCGEIGDPRGGQVEVVHVPGIVGRYLTGDGKNHIFVLDKGSFKTIEGPSGIQLVDVGGINNIGQITG
jgi:hypothetical protein